MKKIKTYKIFNESLKDKLKGKSKEEILNGPSFINKSKDEIFIQACRSGMMWLVLDMINDGADITTEDLDGLYFAIRFGHYKLVKFLLNKKEIIKKINKKFVNNILIRMVGKDYWVVKILLTYDIIKNKLSKYDLKSYNEYVNNEDNALDKINPIREGKLTGKIVDEYVLKNSKPFFSFLGESVEYKKVSNSLFWNFINRMTNLDIKFELNTTNIKSVNNSLNTDDYTLFLETFEINIDSVRYELKYSSALSNILDYLDDKIDNKVKFYIGFKMNSELHFGFIFNDKKYKIGYIYYQSSDFYKLRNLISKTNKEINLLDLSKRFKSKISTMVAINTLVSKYLSKYEDIKIYNSIVDDGFCILIECKNNDILNKNYLNKIIESNIKLSRVKYIINQENRKNKTIYYIIIK